MSRPVPSRPTKSQPSAWTFLNHGFRNPASVTMMGRHVGGMTSVRCSRKLASTVELFSFSAGCASAYRGNERPSCASAATSATWPLHSSVQSTCTTACPPFMSTLASAPQNRRRSPCSSLLRKSRSNRLMPCLWAVRVAIALPTSAATRDPELRIPSTAASTASFRAACTPSKRSVTKRRTILTGRMKAHLFLLLDLHPQDDPLCALFPLKSAGQTAASTRLGGRQFGGIPQAGRPSPRAPCARHGHRLGGGSPSGTRSWGPKRSARRRS
jgi:hypothetical protein